MVAAEKTAMAQRPPRSGMLASIRPRVVIAALALGAIALIVLLSL